MAVELDAKQLYRFLKDVTKTSDLLRIRAYCKLTSYRGVDKTYVNPSGTSSMRERGEGYETKSVSADIHIHEIDGENGKVVERMRRRLLRDVCSAVELMGDFTLYVDPVKKTRSNYTCTIFLKKKPESEKFEVSGDPFNCIRYKECVIDSRETINRYEFCEIRRVVEKYMGDRT